MDSSKFDTIARSLSETTSRRAFLNVLTALGAIALLFPGAAAAKKRRNKPQLNAYGCLDVGKPCQGKDGNCCSGICQGKKPKKGKRDKSTCIAHNALTCTDGQDSCLGTNLYCGSSGICLQTTGKADYCGSVGVCTDCQKDADCEASTGPGAACVVCTVSCPGTGGTACYAAAT